jgi:predicted TIM-barrel fold metal-dependent hydrolase
VSVKISGYLKFARTLIPSRIAAVRAGVVDAFTLDHCLWASDWPYLRATERQDYGPLVQLAGQFFPMPMIAASCSGTRPAACSDFRDDRQYVCRDECAPAE